MKTARVTVVPYDTAWKDAFREIRRELALALGTLALRIEHVGSTSVEGLCAKPCIDVDLVIKDSSLLSTVILRLSEIGYFHEGNLGIPGREAFGYADKPHLMRHHLYVCAEDSAELHRHTVFRDYLRAHPEAAERYGAVKKTAASLFPDDIDGYISYKAPCILELYRACGLEAPGTVVNPFRELSLSLCDGEWEFTYLDHDRTVVRAIVVDTDGFFHFVRADRDDDFGRSVLIETSGGGVEEGEALDDAIRRELREELGAEVEILCRIGTVSDAYNLIHRHNINHYYLCRALSFGERALTEDEEKSFHLSSLRLTYGEAVEEYEARRDSRLGRLIANRELPVLKQAKRILDALKL